MLRCGGVRMQSLMITGGAPLYGSVAVHGAKNSVLPILAAAVLCQSPCVLHNCPQIEDVSTALEILTRLGCRVERQGSSLFVDARGLHACEVPPELARKMRSSVIFLGALAARTGEASVALPGGCPLGARPVDLHRMALEAMGAETTLDAETITCRMGKLHPAHIMLPFPSVGATENAMLAAMRCPGTVVIENAAREPEIADLAGFLRSAGAEIAGAGSGTITIEGGRPLHGTTYTILPDRIETATYLCAAATCGGDVTLRRTDGRTLIPVLDALRASGCNVEAQPNTLRIRAAGRRTAPGRIVTRPYPGFPTDAQALMMAAVLRARGETVFVENIFDDRLRHAAELRKMGADIRVEGNTALVRGVDVLRGAELHAGDLRGGAALVAAALSAEGNSLVTGVKHIKRGYDRLEENLKSLGAAIKTVEIS